ncbi:hypothetical protein [Streptomyces sp. NPDC021020]|uniref:hypothetical protein n=1 Tax=Streptomyces sp. NPDC021020 TaxID=3365109 RepID=UPI00379E7A5B
MAVSLRPRARSGDDVVRTDQFGGGREEGVRVAGRGQDGRGLVGVQRRDGDAGRAQQLCCLAQPPGQAVLRRAPGGLGHGAGTAGRPQLRERGQRRGAAEAVGGGRGAEGLAQDEQDLAAQQDRRTPQLREEVGVLACRVLQRRVRQSCCLRVEFGDLRGQVQALGSYQDLHRGGERVQIAAERRDQGLLFGRRPQREVDRAARRDCGQTVGAEVDHARLVHAADGEARRAGRGWNGVLCTGCDPPREPGRCRVRALRGGDPQPSGRALSYRGQDQPVHRQPVAPPQREEGRGPRCRDGAQ